MKKYNIPKVDLASLKKDQKQNFKERLSFLDRYAEWIKKSDNQEWSSQQKKIFTK
ncbi:MAG: hypothetical protein NTZ02_00610 [Candidatus Woesearchaeota archaeon]|nr:hypothetical protein [Candidatus Woesearchaeota archaeon]